MSNYRPENLLGTTKNTTDSSLWKERYLPDLQLAGDGALSSIDKGLSYARDFMADANPGTDPDKIRTAAVKWALATDTNDEGLKQADFELMDSLAPGSVGTNAIGTPSLSEYIRRKDEYDYKTGRYTTTANASKTPTAQTRELQTLLNRGGYTDRFGNALKEDGILGAKTLYAADRYLTNHTSPIVSNPLLIKKGKEQPSIEKMSQNNSLPKSWDEAEKITKEKLESTDWKKETSDLIDNLPKSVNNAQRSAQRTVWRSASDLIIRKGLGYESAAWLLEHSLQDNPQLVYRADDSRIANLIKQSSAFQNELNSVLKNATTDFSDERRIVNFADGELHYALGHCTISFSGKKDNGKWIISCTLHDIYDFDRIQTFLDENYYLDVNNVSVGTLANDAALISEVTGAITPYHILIDFNVTK